MAATNEFFIHVLGPQPRSIHIQRNGRTTPLDQALSRPTYYHAGARGRDFDQLFMLAQLWGNLSYLSARPVYEIEPEQWDNVRCTVDSICRDRTRKRIP